MENQSIIMPTAATLCILLIFCVNGAVVGQPEFIYNGFAGRNLHLDGAAYIKQDGILSLTNCSSNLTGHAFHPFPVPFASVDDLGRISLSSFSATFVFAITPDNFSPSGDGMAFVVSSTPNMNGGKPGAYMGLSDYEGNSRSFFLAIELDTVFDSFGDKDNNHVGIDLNNPMSIYSSPAGYENHYYVGNNLMSKFEALSLSSGNPMQVWVDYDGTSMKLNVNLSPFPIVNTSQPLLSHTIDMPTFFTSSLNPTYVGFSASTDDSHCAAHQILGWSFSVSGAAPDLDYSLLPLKRGQDGNKKRLIKWLPATISLLVMIAAVTACFLLRCWRKRSAERHREDWEAELGGPRRFSHKDLRAATKGFNTTQLLGKGGFGRVYGGVLAASGMHVAVKRISSESSAQGLAQFTAEILILGRLRHRNLVRLIGYCRHKDELLLVYEHMPNGSLDKYLYIQTKNTLIWSQRLHIIKGVASGLLYLHEDWEQVIIHRDIKASNVLLDAEMNGRLGDFGLARLHDHGVDAYTTHVAGTRGYLSPELTRFGKATKATDVFAFGAFILEVACGRRPVGLNARGELLVLGEWVREVWASSSGCIADAMDPRLDDYATEEAELVLKLGLLCSHPMPAARPGMRLVMQYLEGDMALPAEITPDYLAITDVNEVFEMAPSVATSITSLSGGR